MRIQVPEIEQIAHIHLGVNPQADVTEHEFVLQRARVGGAKVLGGLVTVGGVARGDLVGGVAGVGGAEVFGRLVAVGGRTGGYLVGGVARVGGAKVLGGLVDVGGVARGDFVVDVAWVGGAEVFFRLVCEGVGGGGAVEGHLLGGRHGVEESLILFLADVQESMRVVYLVIFVISVS